ncbi:MAG: hypothetical protein ACRDHI_13665 [Actinomycetota bacterium]
MDASRTHEATHGHSFLSWVLAGAVGLVLAAVIVLAMQWNTNDAVEFSGPATTGRQVGHHVSTVPIGTPDSFDEVRESIPSKHHGGVDPAKDPTPGSAPGR